MIEASTHGRAAPKTKSINVEANLLSQRLAERASIFGSAQRQLIVASIVTVLSFLVLPVIFRLQATLLGAQRNLEVENYEIADRFSALQKAQSAAMPIIERKKLETSAKANSAEFLGQLLLFMNATDANVSLGSVKATVMGGEMLISTKAEAKSYQTASDFVEAASRGPHGKGTLLSSMKANPEIWPDGVTFVLSKKVKVGK